MDLLLLFLALIIMLHEGLLIAGLLLKSKKKKDITSLIASGSMILVALIAVSMDNWSVLAIGFAAYRMFVASEYLVKSLKEHHHPSLLLPVNLLMATAAVVAFLTNIWWIFVLGYSVFWILTYLIGRRLMNRKYHSHRMNI